MSLNLLRNIIPGLFALLLLIGGAAGTANALPSPGDLQPISTGTPALPPVTPNAVPIFEGTINPDTAYCGIPPSEQTFETQLACGTGLAQNLLVASYGVSPGFKLIPSLGVGLNEIGFDRNGQIKACGYVAGLVENIYCGGNVHFSEHGLKTFLGNLGSDMQWGIALIAVHESGHFLQTVEGGINLTPIFMGPGVYKFEQQGDCFAGAALQLWSAAGILPAGFEASAFDLFASLGPDYHEVSHGSGNERQEAAEHGFMNGAAACGDPSEGLILHP